MASAVRAVTARRGHDPRGFALLSFGGAGGLHACALAEALEIPRVIVPPYCGVLSALGMVAAAPVADASQTVVHLGDKLDDARLAAEYTRLSGITMDHVPYEQTESVEAWADVRFRGQSHELKVRTQRPSLDAIGDGLPRVVRPALRLRAAGAGGGGRHASHPADRAAAGAGVTAVSGRDAGCDGSRTDVVASSRLSGRCRARRCSRAARDCRAPRSSWTTRRRRTCRRTGWLAMENGTVIERRSVAAADGANRRPWSDFR